MHDWNLWLNSNETRAVIKLLRESTEDLRDLITDGSNIQEKDTAKISLDYTYSLGQLAGMRNAIETIKDISSIMEEENVNNGGY